MSIQLFACRMCLTALGTLIGKRFKAHTRSKGCGELLQVCGYALLFYAHFALVRIFFKVEQVTEGKDRPRQHQTDQHCAPDTFRPELVNHIMRQGAQKVDNSSPDPALNGKDQNSQVNTHRITPPKPRV